MNIKRYKNGVELYEEIADIEERSKKIHEELNVSNKRVEEFRNAIIKAIKEIQPTLNEIDVAFNHSKYKDICASVTEVDFDLIGK